MVLVWDNLNTRVSRAMRELIAARSWLRVYRLPPYASELNPVEPVWSNLKRSLANLTKQDIGQLTALVKTRLRRMQYRPGLLDGFLAKTGLSYGSHSERTCASTALPYPQKTSLCHVLPVVVGLEIRRARFGPGLRRQARRVGRAPALKGGCP